MTHAAGALKVIKTTFLEMRAPSSRVVPCPREDVAIVHARRPTIVYYRFLYDAVGAKWNWTSRKKLADDALARIIHDPRDEVHVLCVAGVPAGFVELDRRVEGEIEITQFGLMPEFIGQQLGPYFLQWAVHKAWSFRPGPKRLWLHTCTDDHPAALRTYLRAGFSVFKEEVAG